VWTDAFLSGLSSTVDDEVDRLVVEHVIETNETPRGVIAGLGRHLAMADGDRSRAVNAYLLDKPALPEWVDHGKLKKGGHFFDRHGPHIGMALFCASLPESYTSPHGARVLRRTGQLDQSSTSQAEHGQGVVRRVNETAQALVAFMGPRGLDRPSGAGYVTARRVRLMHGAVRYFMNATIAASSDPGAVWDSHWPVPINQLDLVGTLLTFTTVVFDALERLGVVYEPEEADAYLHRWCVVGHFLGIVPDALTLLTTTDAGVNLERAHWLTGLLRTRQQAEWDRVRTTDAAALAGALVVVMQRSLPLGPLLHPLPAAMIEYLTGREVSRINGLSTRDPFALGFDLMAQATHMLGLGTAHDHLMRLLSRRFGAKLLDDFAHAAHNKDAVEWRI
jgi:hypothetical protein